MKIFNGILCLLFIFSAALQFNDPDPIQWVAIYGLAAVISGFAVVGKYNKAIILFGIVVCIIWMATLIPGVQDWVEKGMPSITGSMKAESPHVEYMREFLGLFIVLLALVFHYFQARKAGSKIV